MTASASTTTVIQNDHLAASFEQESKKAA